MRRQNVILCEYKNFLNNFTIQNFVNLFLCKYAVTLKVWLR